MYAGNNLSHAPMLIIDLFAQKIDMKEQQSADGKEENVWNIILESQNHFCLIYIRSKLRNLTVSISDSISHPMEAFVASSIMGGADLIGSAPLLVRDGVIEWGFDKDVQIWLVCVCMLVLFRNNVVLLLRKKACDAWLWSHSIWGQTHKSVQINITLWS